MRKATLLLLLLINFQLICIGQQDSGVDLKNTWLLFTEGRYQPFLEGKESRTIHIVLGKNLKGNKLSISAPQGFAYFINGVMQSQQISTSKTLDIDSLFKVNLNAKLISVYTIELANSNTLSTKSIPKKVEAREIRFSKRTNDGFQDFTVSVFFLLFFAMALLYKSNPKLMSEYLNFFQLFSVKDQDNRVSSNRISSSTNLFYYLLVSFLFAFLILILNQKGQFNFRYSAFFRFRNFLDAFEKFLLLAVVTTLLLSIKLMIILLFSYLFRMANNLQFHFFRFIKFIVLVLTFSAISLFISYTVEKSITLYYLIDIFVIVAAIGWFVLLYLKLKAKTAHYFFHLFCYLCATEIIPTFILIKFTL